MNAQDLQQLAVKGISADVVEKQLQGFRNGFPFLKIDKAAAVGNGILRFTDEEKTHNIAVWEEYLAKGKGKILKFVPASGAASRMFKDLFEILNSDDLQSGRENEFIKTFFDNIEKFAFYEKLDWKCLDIA
ncbi:MAG: DUF4301 family protein, partial [Prevotellaceae bacterium]|nr:DUF4301 family protein [Prevotellaceae bacterium]